MMQSTESGQRDNLATGRFRFCNPTTGRVLPQSEMSSVFMIVANIVLQQPSQVSLVEHNHVVQKLSAYTANPAFRNSVLPRSAKGRSYWLSPQ